jgi:hypothetical protein
MKLAKGKLKQIIREELGKVLSEDDPFKARRGAGGVEGRRYTVHHDDGKALYFGPDFKAEWRFIESFNDALREAGIEDLTKRKRMSGQIGRLKQGRLSPKGMIELGRELGVQIEKSKRLMNMVKNDPESLADVLTNVLTKKQQYLFPHSDTGIRFEYVMALAQRSDGSEKGLHKPVFIYKGNRAYIDILKDAAADYGITITNPGGLKWVKFNAE